jgi:hypothetical protein
VAKKLIATVVRLREVPCADCGAPALYAVVSAPEVALSVVLERQELVNRCEAHLTAEERSLLEKFER